MTDQPFRNLLIVSTIYDLPTHATRQLVDEMRQLGADFVATHGVSDVALARCIAASKAMQALRKRHRFVLWLDGDIVMSPEKIAQLTDWSKELTDTLRRLRPNQKHLRPFRHAAASARYLTQDGNCLAAANLQKGSQQELLCVLPVYSGLGAHVQSVESFVNACDRAPQVPKRGVSWTVPCITASGPMQVDGRTVWSSEDSTYCAWLEQCGTLTYLVPVDAGHVLRFKIDPIWPSPDSPTLDEYEASLSEASRSEPSERSPGQN